MEQAGAEEVSMAKGLSSALVRRGRSVDVSRKLALGLRAALMPGIVFVTRVPIEWAIVIFSLAFFGQQSWSTLVMIVPTEREILRKAGSQFVLRALDMDTEHAWQEPGGPSWVRSSHPRADTPNRQGVYRRAPGWSDAGRHPWCWIG